MFGRCLLRFNAVTIIIPMRQQDANSCCYHLLLAHLAKPAPSARNTRFLAVLRASSAALFPSVIHKDETQRMLTTRCVFAVFLAAPYTAELQVRPAPPMQQQRGLRGPGRQGPCLLRADLRHHRPGLPAQGVSPMWCGAAVDKGQWCLMVNLEVGCSNGRVRQSGRLITRS